MKVSSSLLEKLFHFDPSVAESFRIFHASVPLLPMSLHLNLGFLHGASSPPSSAEQFSDIFCFPSSFTMPEPFEPSPRLPVTIAIGSTLIMRGRLNHCFVDPDFCFHWYFLVKYHTSRISPSRPRLCSPPRRWLSFSCILLIPGITLFHQNIKLVAIQVTRSECSQRSSLLTRPLHNMCLKKSSEIYVVLLCSAYRGQ